MYLYFSRAHASNVSNLNPAARGMLELFATNDRMIKILVYDLSMQIHHVSAFALKIKLSANFSHNIILRANCVQKKAAMRKTLITA